MMFREMLYQDFGKKFPIAGGWGQSAKDPILVVMQSPEEAALVKLEITRTIYGALGWYWRQIERVSVAVDSGYVEKCSFEVKYLENDQVVTAVRNLYFDLSIVNIADGLHLEDPSILVGPPAKINFPMQLGWFHYDGLTNNESVHPGLGVSLAFSAPYAKMTIYAYDKGLAEKIISEPDASANLEYIQAVADFRSANPEARLAREYGQDGKRLSIFESERTVSLVLVLPYKDFFFKLRATLEGGREQYMVDCVMDTVSILAFMVGQQSFRK